MRRALLGVAVLGAALVVAAALWIRKGKPHRQREGERSDFQLRVARFARADGTATDAPTWAGQRGVPDRRIAGRVLFEGEPVPKATVELLQPELRAAGIPAPHLVTDEQGGFDFGTRPAAQYFVLASAPGYASNYERIDARDPTAARATDRLEIRLGNCEAKLSGTVGDVSGGPVAGAEVTFDFAPHTTTNEQGHYEMCVVDGFWLEVRAEGYASAGKSVTLLKHTVADIELSPEALIVGRTVRADDGAPLPFARVAATSAEAQFGRGRRASAVADASGEFRIDGLSPERYQVTAEAGEWQTSEPVEVSTLVGEPPESVTCRLDRLAIVRGKVVTTDGSPVAGAQVVRDMGGQNRNGVVSQEDGSFELTAAPGDLKLAVRYYTVESDPVFSVKMPEVEITLRVSKKASIRGRVTRNGQPVSDASVRVASGPRQVGGGSGQTTFTNTLKVRPDGRYVVEGLDPGTYALSAQNEEAFAKERTVTVGKGESLGDVDFELDLAGTITGTVVDQDGKPVPGVAVKFSLIGGNDTGFDMATDEQGAFFAGAMSGGGDYSVEIYYAQPPLKPAEGNSFPTVHLEDGSSRVDGVRFAVQLDRLTIAGRVTRPDGSAVPDARVEAIPGPYSQRSYYYLSGWWKTTSTADGTFEIGNMLGGDYSVVAKSSGGESRVERVKAGTTDVRLVLAEPGSILGTLVGFSSTPTVQAMTIPPDKLLTGRVSGSEFSFRNVPPGTYDVVASGKGEFGRARAKVTAGGAAQVSLQTTGTATVNARAIELRTKRAVPKLRCGWSTARAPNDEPQLSARSRKQERTDGNGAVALSVPAATPVEISCYPDDHDLQRVSPARVQLAAGATESVDVVVVTAAKKEEWAYWGGQLDYNSEDARIRVVIPGGPADRAGLKAGDSIIAIDNTDVRGVAPFALELAIVDRPIGERASLQVLRDGRPLDFDVAIEERKPGGRR